MAAPEGTPTPAAAEPGLLAHREEKRLLGFYDRLRRRILAAVEKKAGRLGAGAVRALLLVPDVFLLLVRLLRDPEVPGTSRAAIGAVVAYFLLPADLLPELLLGGAGFLDDLVLATAVLTHAFGPDLEPFARKHWSGPGELRPVLAEVSASARNLLGTARAGGVQQILARLGFAPPQSSDPDTAPPAGASPSQQEGHPSLAGSRRAPRP